MKLAAICALLLLSGITAQAKEKNESDYPLSFTVIGSWAPPDADHFCPTMVRGDKANYSVYSQTWQCVQFPLGSVLKARFKKPQLHFVKGLPYRFDVIEFIYRDEKKNKPPHGIVSGGKRTATLIGLSLEVCGRPTSFVT